MSKIKPHPSNILSAGEATDFIHAMNLVIDQCNVEARIEDNHSEGDDPSRNLQTLLNSYAGAARRCKASYLQRVRSAELELAKELQASDDEDVRKIGVALEEQDYSSLAI